MLRTFVLNKRRLSWLFRQPLACSGEAPSGVQARQFSAIAPRETFLRRLAVSARNSTFALRLLAKARPKLPWIFVLQPFSRRLLEAIQLGRAEDRINEMDTNECICRVDSRPDILQIVFILSNDLLCFPLNSSSAFAS
jgi:hypothetical protein